MPAIRVNSSVADNDGRLASLDVFRGVCALAVFLTHWFLWANFLPQTGFQWLLNDCLKTTYSIFCQLTWNCRGQHPAVIGFFVLSGFCIHASRARRTSSAAVPHEWRHYFLSRSRRILPVYWWGTLLALGFVGLQTTWPVSNPVLSIHAAGDGRDLLLRVFAISALVPGDVILGNWTLITVSTEIAIYALYPLLLLSTRYLGWVAPLAVWIALQVVALFIAPHFSPTWLVNTPLIMGAYWYVGMLAAEWHFRKAKVLPLWVPLLTWVLFLLLREAPDSALRYIILQLVRSLHFATILLWLLGLESTRPSFRASAFVRSLCLTGRISYSLYVVHTPVILATTWALGALTSIHSNAVQLLVTFSATLAVTAVTYRYIERPFLAVKKS
ncbi:MAG: acyltransferase [Opitutaceae bacterium]